MKKYQQKAGWFSPVKGYSFAIVALLVVSVCFAFFSQSRSDALTTVPTRMNFQGRLADSTGNIKPNGTYNMRLRLYTAASGGTAVWTEDRLVSAGTGITLTNGLFALQLGSVTSLPASLFASGPLYLEVELPTPATATTSSPSWLEGAMTPRNQMATSAYAYNSETLDGQDGSYYQDASNLAAGTLNSARITGAYANLTGTGALVSGSIASGFGTIATTNTIQGSRLISTVATGTAPLTVTSTTKVTNLNVDLLDGLDSTAFAMASSLSGYVQLQGVSPGTAQTGNINISGTVIAGGFSGAGSGLTNLSATNLSSGTINTARVSGAYTGITGLGTLTSLAVSGTATVGGLSVDGANSLYLSDAGITGQGISIVSGEGMLLNAAYGIDAYAELRVNAGFKVKTGSQSVVDVDTTTSAMTLGQASTTDAFTKLTDPESLPTGTGNRVSYSPDGQYMSVAHFTSPFVTIYKRSGDTFTKLANPAVLPTGSGYGTDFSPDGQYMTVAHSTSPYITIYKRSGDTFTKLADPAALPSGIGINVSFSPDGVYMSVGLNTAPYLAVYKRSGDTFTKLADPTTPGSAGNDVNFSSDGLYMTVASQSSPYVHIYKRSGDRFAKLANPATLPTGSSYESTFSPDGQYMTVAHSTSPYITIYKRSGDTFTKLADPAVLPTTTTRAVDFSPDGNYLSVGVDGGLPRLVVYKRSGDTFTKLADAATQPAGGVVSAEFSPNGQYLSVSHNLSPYITTYRVGSGNSVDVMLNGAISSTGAIQGSRLDITGFANLQGGASVQGLLNVQGRGMFTQADGTQTALLIQGKPSPQFGDAPLFEIQDGAGGYLLTATQHVGNVVYVRGGSGFWGTAALQVAPAASNAYALKISGAGGQTASLIRVEDSSGNQLFAVGANGSVVSAAGLQGTTLSLSGSATVSGSVTAGSMYSSGWFYSTGDTGWYNSTYGGGLQMTDSTWIRTYGSKYFFAASGLDTGGPSGIGCNGGLGGGYTFRVCGSGNITGGLTTLSLTSSGGTTLAGDFWWGGAQTGIQGTMCVGVGNNVFRNNGGCAMSSIRFKENVTTLDSSALSLIQQLRPVSFDWKQDYNMTGADGSKHDFGVIAEEVEEILPNLVTYDSNGQVNGVKYEGFIPFLIRAVQEQQSQIAQLQGTRSTVDELTVNGRATIGSDLNVSGMTNLKNLTVNGDAVVAGKLEVKGHTSVQSILVNGHIITGGNALSVQPSSLFGADELMATVEGNDTTGTITITLDDQATMPSGIDIEDGVSILGATFAQQFGATPRILISPANVNAGNLKAFTSSESRDGFTISAGSLPQQGKTYKFTYWVAQ